MRRGLLIARFPLFLTLVLAIALLADPGRAELAVHVYVLVARGDRARPPARGSARRAPATRAVSVRRCAANARCVPQSGSPSSSAWSARSRWDSRPTSTSTTACGRRLRRIATELLAARRGIDLDANPDAAHRALGDDAWEIVRGDREPSREPFADGVDIASLRLAVSALEGL